MVPDVIGWPEEEAIACLARAGYAVEKEYTGPASHFPEAERRVVRQRLAASGKVVLVVAPVLWKGGGGACPTVLRKSALPAAFAPTSAPTGQSRKETTPS